MEGIGVVEKAARAERLEPTVVAASARLLWRALLERQSGATDVEAHRRLTAEQALGRLRGYVSRWT